MKLFALLLIFCAVFFSNLALASSIISNDQPSNVPDNSNIHTLEVRCRVGVDQLKISRISILDVRGAKDQNIDLGITTAHGLLDSSGDALNRCNIRGFAGESYRISDVQIAKNYSPGTANDWAIVVLERAKKTDLVRYAFASPLSIDEFDGLADARLPLTFSSARGVPDGRQSCEALPRPTVGMNKSRYDGLIPHNCKAVSGQSGAPISVFRGNQNIILGLHIGHAFWAGVPDVNAPAKLGYMRVFDNELVEIINSNVTALMEKQ